MMWSLIKVVELVVKINFTYSHIGHLLFVNLTDLVTR